MVTKSIIMENTSFIHVCGSTGISFLKQVFLKNSGDLLLVLNYVNFIVV